MIRWMIGLVEVQPGSGLAQTFFGPFGKIGKEWKKPQREQP